MSNTVQIIAKNAVQWVEFKVLQQYHNLKHFSTTKLTGSSFLPFQYLNLGFIQYDSPQNVIVNRNLLSLSVDIPIDSFVFANQTHSNNVYVVKEQDKGKGVLEEQTEIDDIDAFIVYEKGICPVVQTADCVPIILFEPQRNIAAVVHSGWRGTAKQILLHTILKMHQLSADIDKIIVCIGPSACGKCYEVKDDVWQTYNNVFGNKAKQFFEFVDDKMYLNLPLANQLIAINIGINPQNIHTSDLCTIHNHKFFFSARLDHQNTGRMLTGVYLL